MGSVLLGGYYARDMSVYPGQFDKFARGPVGLGLDVVDFSQLLFDVAVVFLGRGRVIVVVVLLQMVAPFYLQNARVNLVRF